jgi:inhibitor of cysteine peptidase
MIFLKINGCAVSGVSMLVFAVAVSAVFLSGCTESISPADDVIDNDNETIASFYSEIDNGSTIFAAVGDTFEIRLEENPTIGYQWNLAASDGLTILEDEFSSTAAEGLVGSGGVHIWKIGVDKAGEQSVDAIYSRPWENTTGEEDIFTMKVSVSAEDPDEGAGNFVYGTAMVEDVQILVLESFPVQVRLSVSGYLPDGCTEIDEENIT